MTFVYEDANRIADAHLARRIARRFGLDHALIPLSEPTEAQKQEYLVRTGWAEELVADVEAALRLSGLSAERLILELRDRIGAQIEAIKVAEDRLLFYDADHGRLLNS